MENDTFVLSSAFYQVFFELLTQDGLSERGKVQIAFRCWTWYDFLQYKPTNRYL